ncbi:MAG: hypothetical protein AB1578_14815 [Thermodesulfobacteriota bacterium]
MRRAALAVLAAAALLGCATHPEPGPSALADAVEQRLVAALLDVAVSEIRSEVGGLDLRVRVAPEDAFFSRYARVRLEHAVREGGGTVASGADASLLLEVRLAGRERAERNLLLPLGQYVRVPLYYGQEDQSALGARVHLEGPAGARTWDVVTTYRDRSSYLFRVIGPF